MIIRDALYFTLPDKARASIMPVRSGYNAFIGIKSPTKLMAATIGMLSVLKQLQNVDEDHQCSYEEQAIWEQARRIMEKFDNSEVMDGGFASEIYDDMATAKAAIAEAEGHA